jgi:hypothetical protein
MKSTIHYLGSLAIPFLMLFTTSAIAQSVVKETTTTTTTTSSGTISELGPETFFVTTTSSVDPVGFSYSKTTTYVDEDGNPVSIETVKSGLPVTVYYDMTGDKMVATKVIVKKVEVVPAS